MNVSVSYFVPGRPPSQLSQPVQPAQPVQPSLARVQRMALDALRAVLHGRDGHVNRVAAEARCRLLLRQLRTSGGVRRPLPSTAGRSFLLAAVARGLRSGRLTARAVGGGESARFELACASGVLDGWALLV